MKIPDSYEEDSSSASTEGMGLSSWKGGRKREKAKTALGQKHRTKVRREEGEKNYQAK